MVPQTLLAFVLLGGQLGEIPPPTTEPVQPAPNTPASAPAAPQPVSYPLPTAPTASPSVVQEPEPRPVAPTSWEAGILAGVLLPGEVYIEEADSYFDTDQGLLLHAFAESVVAPRLSVGAFGQVAFSGVQGVDATMTTVGATMKLRFVLDKMIVRPGLTLGYQVIDPDGASSSKGLDVGAVLDCAFRLSPSLVGLLQLGFVSQPAGGNEDITLTFAPIFYLAAGVQLGR